MTLKRLKEVLETEGQTKVNTIFHPWRFLKLIEFLERAQVCLLNNGQGKEKWLEDFKEEYDYKA
jgi:hypothetical protein